MRVPLFVKPAVKDFPGVIVDDLVSNVDIAATCIDVAGGTVPDELSDYSYSQYWDLSLIHISYAANFGNIYGNAYDTLFANNPDARITLSLIHI